MSKREENRKKLDEIYQRLDKKAKILYVAYKNGRLDLDSLNNDMRERITKLDKPIDEMDSIERRIAAEKISEIMLDQAKKYKNKE